MLGAGSSCKLKARLAPTSVGAKQATYTVSLAGSIVDVAVTGTGDPVPQAPANPGGSTNANTNPQPSSAEAVLVGTRTKAGKGGKLKLRAALHDRQRGQLRGLADAQARRSQAHQGVHDRHRQGRSS